MPLPFVLPGVVAALIGGLGAIAGQLAWKVLAALGIGYVTYTGVNVLVDQYQPQILQALQALPPVALQLAGVLKVGTCVNIMFSAMAMRATLAGLNAGSIKKMQVNG